MSALVIIAALGLMTISLIYAKQVWKYRNQFIAPHALYGISAGIYYGGGVLVVYLTTTATERNAVLNQLGTTDGYVLVALLFTTVWLVLVELFVRIRPKALRIPTQQLHIALEYVCRPAVFWPLILVVMMIQGRLLFHLQILSLDSFATEGKSYVNPVEQLLFPFRSAVLAICAYRIGKSRQILLTGCVFLVQMAIMGYLGRRIFVISMAFAFGCLLLSRPPKRTLVFASTLAISSVIAVFFWFLTFRMVGNEDPNTTFGLRIAEANRAMLSGSTEGGVELRGALMENVQKRSFEIGYLAMLMANPAPGLGAHGEVLRSSIALTIPRLFYRNKAAIVMQGGAEGIAAQWFPLPRYIDEASTFLTCAYIDFGWFGFIYIPIFLFCLSLGIWLVKAIRYPIIVVVAVASLTYNYMEFERELVYYFVFVRDMVIFWIASRAIEAMGGFWGGAGGRSNARWVGVRRTIGVPSRSLPRVPRLFEDRVPRRIPRSWK